jgi:hypothetical protein
MWAHLIPGAMIGIQSRSDNIPTPPTFTVTATSAIDPAQSAKATVTLV